MEEETSPRRLAVALSRQELMTVLGVMHARLIPGLEPAPRAEMSPEEAAEAESEAVRALQARDLAQVDAEGRLLIHRALLTLVGTCAFSRSALIAFHWPAGQEVPVRFYGHVRDADVVLHTQPAETEHRFERLPSKERLVDLALETCEFRQAPASQPLQVLIPRAAFNRARELASQGQAADAAETLRGVGVSTDVAEGLSAALAAAPRISALQTLKQQANDSVRTREFTLIQDGGSAWLAMPTAVDPTTPLLVRTVGRNELRALLTEWL